MTDEPAVLPGRTLTGARLVIGLAQGLALYALYRAAEQEAWPATDGLVFAPLLMLGWFLPVLLLLGVGNLQRRALLIWAAGAALVLIGLALHDLQRGGDAAGWTLWDVAGGRGSARNVPTVELVFYAAAALFIAQSLIVAGNGERRFLASYPACFDAAWKQGVQLLLAFCFVGVFWGLLSLGAGLFDLIKLDFLERLIRHHWFAIPATTLALAAALHLTDVRAGLVRGVRTLGLTLLAWLLPLLTLIAVGFLASLPATGLEPLWKTRYATSLLLSVAAALVVLINATYQDGAPERRPPRFLRIAGSAAAVALVPLVAIGGYALSLRVAQHGWTSDRIIATACLFVGACYALGYAAALVASSAWLKRLETCNVITAYVVLGVLLALFTPLADPARLSVADQMARLRSGKVAPADFDFAYLRFEGARYGIAALEQLKTEQQGTGAAAVRQLAAQALALKYRYQKAMLPLTPAELAANITAYPAGRVLPESFLRQDWPAKMQTSSWLVPQCLINRTSKCDAFAADLDGDGTDELMLLNRQGYARMVVFKQSADGAWAAIATLPHRATCAPVLEALRAGKFAAVPSPLRQLEVAGQRFQLELTPEAGWKCP